jgi:hypothetical protein
MTSVGTRTVTICGGSCSVMIASPGFMGGRKGDAR